MASSVACCSESCAFSAVWRAAMRRSVSRWTSLAFDTACVASDVATFRCVERLRSRSSAAAASAYRESNSPHSLRSRAAMCA